MIRHALVATSLALATLASPTSTDNRLAEPAQCPYNGTHPTPPKNGGEGVTHLQCLLRNVWGYHDVVIDGIAGPTTRDAVVAHQIDCEVPVDGRVGPQTWLLLHPDTSTPECPDAPRLHR